MNINIKKYKSTKNHPLCHHSLAALILFNALPLYANDELFFDMPVVLSANRLEQPVANAAVSISVIDRETIVASGARSIPEVLRLVPGIQVGYSGNMFGGEPKYVVSYHGHSNQFSKQMQVLIDGRSIYEPFLGGINWKAVPVNISDIERIEVSRGPNLATYGSNSFQAAINIITRTAAEDQGSFIQSNVGNNDIADLTYRYGGNNGKLDYRFTVSSYNDAGLDSANEYDYNDDTHSDNIDYRLDYQLDARNTLSYQGGFGSNTQQADQNHDGLISGARTVDNTRFFQFIKWENAINQDNTLLLQYYYNLSDKEDQSQSKLIPFGSGFRLDINDSIKSERHNLELTHFKYLTDDLKFVWGASAQADYVHAPLYLGSDEDLSNKQLRGFANIEWHVNESNIINFGALTEKNDFTETELSPRLSLTHIFNKQHSIRLGISKAIRSPFILEAQADRFYTQEVAGLPEPLYEQAYMGGIPAGSNLENESIISREFSYFGNFFNSALLFNARLFHDDISDYIDTEPQDIRARVPEDNIPDDLSDFGDLTAENNARVFVNEFDSTTTGLELELDYRIDSTLRVISSGAIINIQSTEDSIRISAPQHSFSFLTSKQFNEKYNGSLVYYYVDKFQWKDSRDGTTYYQTLDMRFSRNFKLNNNRGSLSIVLKNLLGDYSDYQEKPRYTGGSLATYMAPVVVNSTLAYIDFMLNF